MTLARSQTVARALAVLALLGACQSRGLAQAPGAASSYQADEIDKSVASRGQIVRRFVTRGEGDRAEFENYFSRYYFPAMTQPSAEGLADLGKLSGDLFKNFLYAGGGDTQAWLSTQALEWSKRVALGPKYHPAVRLNAVLIMGRLDDKYDRDAPVPSAGANDFLCKLAASGATNPRVPRYLLTAALTGLERHTRFFAALPGPQKSNTARTLYGVLNAKGLAGEYGDGVKDWVYLQTASAIANLKTVGPKGAFAIAIGKRVADDSLAIETRVELASKLADLNGKPGEVPAAPLVKVVAALAAEVALQEDGFADEFQKLQIGSTRVAVAGVSRSKSGRRFKESVAGGATELVREPVLQLLTQLRAAVRATSALAAEGGDPTLAKIEAAIAPALAAASDKDSIDLNVTTAVRKMARDVAAAVPAVEPKPAAEDDEPAAAGVAARTE